jgi:hypothetical protein
MPTISGYASGEPIEAVDINAYFLRGNRNAIINGDMRVSQRFGTTATSVADVSYGLDRWVSLGSGAAGVGSSGQNVTVTQDIDAPTGGLNSMKMAATTNNLKFGCVQIIENRNIAGISSGTVTVSFKAKDTAGITDVRCAVLGWSDTADAVTRDVVSTSGTPWLSSPPTLASSWSYLNTPANLNVTNSWADYRINANVTGNPKNIAVFIWVNSTTHTTSDALNITDVQLESGAIATPYERKSFQEELANCQRYYFRIQSSGATLNRFGLGVCGATTFANVQFPFPVTLRIAPTAIETFATASAYGLTTSVGAVVACTIAPTYLASNQFVGAVSFTTSSSLAGGNATEALANNSASAFIAWNVEL